jgi:beta-lactamase regulating signal transducer with metallopeptidase domain
VDLLARSLLTYLLHSSVLLGLASLARLLMKERRLAVQEAVLRAALVGGFVTAGLQVGLELKPVGGALALPSAAVELRAESPGPRSVASVEPGTGVLPAAGWNARAVLAPTFVERGAAALASLRSLSWRSVLGLAWGALAVLALLRLAAAALRLRWLLRDRRPIRGGSLVPEAAAVAGALGLRSTVRLSAAPHLGVPLATGVLRPEVCLPTRAVTELGADEQVALCAHELAHVARHDPAWILLARLAEAAAPLQPLNGWARRRLLELAECLSDDLAVAASARPVGLARSLVDVASWTLGERPVLPAAAAFALSARSRLGHRVERLMDPFRSLERPRRMLLPLASAAVLATALVTPVVSGSAAVAPSDAISPQAARAVAPDADAAPEAAQAVPHAEAARDAEPASADAAPKGQAAPRDEAAGAGRAAQREAERADLERRLEALSKRIAERARLHEGEMKKLDAEIQAVAARMQPNEAEMQRLSRELGAAAQELAAAVTENVGSDRPAKAGERASAAARRMAELRERLHTLTRDLHADEARAIAEKARALAEQARPSPDELREIRQLSRELARESLPDMRELDSIAREAMDEVRRAMDEARKAMREAAEATRHAAEETPKQHE